MTHIQDYTIQGGLTEKSASFFCQTLLCGHKINEIVDIQGNMALKSTKTPDLWPSVSNRRNLNILLTV